MPMKRSEIVTSVQYNLGGVTGLATHINNWMNWAQEDIASVFNWRDLYVESKRTVTTSPDTWEYALPESVKTFHDVQLQDGSNSRSLTPVDPRVFRKQRPYPQNEGTGKPREYTWEGHWLKFYPIPDDVYPVWLSYTRWPEDYDLNADTYSPIKRIDAAIVAQATAYGYEARREPDRKIFWHAEAWTILKRRAKAENNDDWTPRWATERLGKLSQFRKGLWVPPWPTGTQVTQLNYT